MDYNPWHPMNDKTDLKTLGKLGEECGELSAAVCRCLIQGIDQSEPVTGKPNKQWLMEEIADVLVSAQLVVDRFNLDGDAIAYRVLDKLSKLKWWHEQA